MSFVPDFVAILPIDFALLIWPHNSLLRLNRLAKLGRVSEFIALTEHNCPWPLSFRLLRLGTICYLLFHWNACFYFLASKFYGYANSTSDSWTFSHQKIPDLMFAFCDPRFDIHRNECLMPETDWRLRDRQIDQLRDHWANRSGHTAFGNVTKKYAMSFYWSALTLVTLGEQPWPENSVQSVFEIVDTLIGLLVFAAIIGDVGIMVSRSHSAKANFQEFVDGCKHYMHIRHVNQQMHDRVIKWVEYQWMGAERGLTVDENELLYSLPPRLARELAAEFHLNALTRSPGSVPLSALCAQFDHRRQSQFESGMRTREELIASFLETFEPDSDGKVLAIEFLAFYAAKSVAVQNDIHFDWLLRSQWKI